MWHSEEECKCLQENHKKTIPSYTSKPTTDDDYGPEAINPATHTNQEELEHICNEYIQSLQITVK